MPIVVDPGFSPPAPPAVATSVDGRLSVFADIQHAGARLLADYTEKLLLTNRAVNPGLTTGATYWSQTAASSGTTTGTRVTSGGPTISGRVMNFFRQQWTAVTSGVLSSTGALIGSPSADAIVLVPGQVNTISVYARSSVATRTAQLIVTSHKNDGTNQVVEASTVATAIGGGWVRLTVSFTPAAGQVRGYCRVYNVGGPTHVVGDQLDVTAILGGPAGDYFDGDTPADTYTVNRWLATAGASASGKYRPGPTVNAQVLSGTVTGWAAYAAGGAAASLIGSAVRVSVTTAGASAGAVWTLPSVVPAGPVEVAFSWQAVDSFAGLLADRFRVDLRNASNVVIASKDFNGVRGSKAGSGWRWRTTVSQPVASAVFYLNGSVGVHDVIFLDARVATQLPLSVRFARTDGTLVRSGDTAPAPGGVAVAYDHEAPTGGPVSWVATPIYAGGYEGAPTQPAAIAVVAPPPSRVWLKSLQDPDLSVLVRVATAEEAGRAFRTSLTPAVGNPLPSGGWDTPMGWAGDVAFRTDTQAEYDALVEVLSSGVLLMQSPDCAGLPQQLYVLPSGVMAAKRMAGATTGQGWKYRIWPIGLTEVPRPATVDSPLMIPGLSYDDLPGAYATYDTLLATVPSYLALLGVPV